MKKYTQQEACEIFKSYGVILLGVYRNRRFPVECICICQEKTHITLHDLQKKRFCKSCNHRNNPIKQKLTNTQVKSEVESFGMILLEQYHSFHTPLHLICECGNEFKMSLPNIRQGKRCGCKYQRKENHHAWIVDRNLLKERNKFKKACYSLIQRSLNGGVKTNRTKILLGYTAEDLRVHITNHIDYPKCLQTGKPISIDHIFPLKAFSDYGLLNESNIWLINHLTNLQPSINQWNSSKNDKYDTEAFASFLEQHDINFSILKKVHSLIH